MIDAGEQSNKPEGLRRVLTHVGMLLGTAAVGTGVLGIAFGSFWAPTALGLFAGHEKFELVVPFMPIILIAMGAYVTIKSRQ